jgi:putative DNA primase/helicase
MPLNSPSTVLPSTMDFASLAPALIKNGYLPIPIVPGDKKPAIANWSQVRDIDPAQYVGHGVGLLTGQAHGDASAIIAVDIDIDDEEVALQMREHVLLGLGETIWRVGRAPRAIMVYRAEAGWAKSKSSVYSAGSIEVLAYGQQFVAFGVHPTGVEYTWPGMLSGPDFVPAWELPTVTSDLIENLFRTYHTTMVAAGHRPLSSNFKPRTEDDEDVPGAFVPSVGLTLEDAAAALEKMDVDNRGEWVEAGMAMHHEFDHSLQALGVWDAWSRKSEKFVEGECARLWAGFGRREEYGRCVTGRTLLYHANKAAKEERAHEVDHEMRMLDTAISECADPETLLEVVAPKVGRAIFGTARRAKLLIALKARYDELAGTPIAPKDLLAAVDRSALTGTRELTELGNGHRFVDKYGARLMYVPEMERWYLWDGFRWELVVKERVLRLASRAVAGILDEVQACEGEKDKARLANWYKASQTASMLDNMVKLAQHNPAILVPATNLDCNPDYIGVANGAVHLPSGGLIPPDRAVHLTINTGVPYEEDAACPLFEQTVRDAFFGNEELYLFLRRVVGYALLGRPEKEEIICIPEGKGANGKSTIFNAISDSLGGYAKYAAADTFVSARAAGATSAAREDVLRLLGARFVYVTELEENGILKESFVKGMTGGEAIPARGLYARHTIEVVPSWVAFMPTNHLPIIKGEDKGIWRKIVVIPFSRDYTADKTLEKDTERKNKLRAEAPGILRWCVEGALDYLKQGLNVPASIQRASHEYKDEMDLMGDWFIMHVDTSDPEAVTTNAELWLSWEMYARSQGTLNMINSSNALARRLASRGFARIRINRGRGFVGLKLKAV